MLIRLIKRDDLFGLFLIPAAGALFWLKSFISPSDISGFGENGAMPLYSLVYSFLERLPSLHVFIAFILVAWNSFLITRLSSSFLLFRKGSRLPGVIYMFVISSWKILQCLHPVHIATFFVLAAIFNIFKTYQKELEIGLTFNASFLLAGEVVIDDFAILGGHSGVHQFCHIGKHVMLSGGSLVRKDVPPYIKAGREPLSYAGVNSIGLRRRAFSNEVICQIQDIYRIIYQKGYNNSQALEVIEAEMPASTERDEILLFLKDSKRGIIKGYFPD